MVFTVIAAGYNHMAHPNRNPGAPQGLQESPGLLPILPGQIPVPMRGDLLHIVQHQIRQGQNVLILSQTAPGRIQTGVDPLLPAKAQALPQKIGLHQRLSAGKGHAAAAAGEIGAEPPQLFHQLPGRHLFAALLAPGIRIMAEPAPKPAPLQKDHRPNAGAVHQAHALN